MKNHFKAAALAASAMLAAPAPAMAQTLEQTINEGFADAHGRFVSPIFSPFPGARFTGVVRWRGIAATVCPP